MTVICVFIKKAEKFNDVFLCIGISLKMAYSMMTVFTHVVPDATNAWVTRESTSNVAIISFWYNPNAYSAMTLRDVVDTIESQLGHLKIGHVTVRGVVIQRDDLSNHRAAEHLRDKESFNCHLVPVCCTIL